MPWSLLVAPFLVWLFLAGTVWSRLAVLTSFAPVHCFVLNVAGEAAEVSVLVPPGTGPHDFSFSPIDIAKIAHADVLVINGVGIESWLDRGIRAVGKRDLRIIDTSRGIDLITGLEQWTLAGTKSVRDPDAGGPNPHIWLSPRNAITQVKNIRDGLAACDPENAQVYSKNTDAYLQRLKNLDRDIATATRAIKNKTLITFHDTFPYFARDYGFAVAASFEEFPGREPSPRAIKQLRDIIESARVAALFSEPQYSPRAMQVMAQELQLPVIPLDPMETGDGSKDFYEDVMRRNLESLLAAFHERG